MIRKIVLGLILLLTGSRVAIAANPKICTTPDGNYSTRIDIDSLYLGDPESEISHRLYGWSEPWIWAAEDNYPNDPPWIGWPVTFRSIIGPNDCDPNKQHQAYFAFNTGSALASQITIEHSNADSFNFYLWNPDIKKYDLLDDGSPDEFSYQAAEGDNGWGHQSNFYFPSRNGQFLFKIVTAGSYCSEYGRVAVNKIILSGVCHLQSLIPVGSPLFP